MLYVCILGRQPALGIAELESYFNSQSITVIQPNIVLLDTEFEVNFDYFGGILKVAKIVGSIDSDDWRKITKSLQKELPGDWQTQDSKLTLGLSTYGLKTNSSQINATALSLKKSIKQWSGRSVRIVPNKETELNTAQVIHNKLTGPKGLELLLIKNGRKTTVAQTNWVQDIEAYRLRDQERPMRDSRVGMLPPKLAQIIVNLSGAKTFGILWDPFCGTGVLLQEALLMGIDVYGSDIEPRMIDYSQKNLDWLAKQRDAQYGGDLSMSYKLQTADATSLKLTSEHTVPIQHIAAETYLGRPLTSLPDKEALNKIVQDCNTIHKKFLQNICKQTETGFRMCIAVPAWRIANGFKRLPVLDHLEELGYNRVSFEHVRTSDLIYHRDGQTVGRELVVLIRK